MLNVVICADCSEKIIQFFIKKWNDLESIDVPLTVYDMYKHIRYI